MPDDYRLDLVTSSRHASTLGRPNKLTSDYSTSMRSKSLDRRNSKASDSLKANATKEYPALAGEQTAYSLQPENGSPKQNGTGSRSAKVEEESHIGFDPKLRYFGEGDMENYMTITRVKNLQRNGSQDLGARNSESFQRYKLGELNVD